MDNKENKMHVETGNETSSSTVQVPLKENKKNKEPKQKKSFLFKKKNKDEAISTPIQSEEVSNIQSGVPSYANTLSEENSETTPVVNDEVGVPLPEVSHDLPKLEGEEKAETVPVEGMPMVKEESSSITSVPEQGAPIFNAEAMEATTSSNEVPKASEDNFVPPADFTSIFHVDSEEKAAMPASVRTDKDIQESVNTETNPVTEMNAGENVSETSELKHHKSKKKEVFNSNEKVLYEIKPEKEGNPIVVILFFMLLLGTIVILPYISRKFDYNNLNPNPPTSSEEEEESDFYYFNRSSVRAVLDGLEFTNFVKHTDNGEYLLTFNISNKNNTAYQYDKKYYVLFYDESLVVYRALIHTYDVIGANAVQEVTLIINERGYKSADRFRIVELPVSTYPDVEVLEKDGDYSVLKCSYRNDEMKYYFLDNKLAKLVETYTETMEGSRTYEADKAAYKNLSTSYKNVNNFSSTFVETNTYFTMINEFNHRDIADATLANLKTYKFFKYNENINTVSFELEAQGYTCG